MNTYMNGTIYENKTFMTQPSLNRVTVREVSL